MIALLHFFLLHANVQLSTGQGLTLGTITIPNVTLVEVTFEQQQVDCTSPGNLPVGRWYYPSGEEVPVGDNPPVYAVYNTAATVVVQRTLPEDGIYSCIIRETNGNIYSIYYVGLYNSIREGRPKLSAVTLTVEDSSAVLFSLNCPSSSFPPTTVTWIHNGSVFSEGETMQVLRDAPSTQFDNILHVSSSIGGTFACQVVNVKGNTSANITINVPSLPPDVQLIPIGDNKVLVQWTPLLHATVYVVNYSTFLASRIVVVDNGSANSAILVDISVGVDYSITVQVNGDIPGLVSNAVSITLTAPPAPSFVTVVSLSPTSLRVSWEQVFHDDVLGYLVNYTSVNELYGGRHILNGWGNTSLCLKGLQESTNYSIVLQTKGTQGYGLQSVPVYKRTLTTETSVPTIFADKQGAPHWLYPFIGTVFVALGILASSALLAVGIRIKRKRNVKIDRNLCYEPTRQTDAKKIGDSCEDPVYEAVLTVMHS